MEKTTVKIKKIKDSQIHDEEDVVICEYPLTIYINQEEFITLLCTPKDLKELTYGFLYSEGLIKNKDEVKKYTIDKRKGIIYVQIDKELDMLKKLHGKRTRTTGCGKGTIFYHVMDSFKSYKIESSLKIKSERIINLSQELNKKSTLFIETGGVHATMLISEDKEILFFEDVGRHNTIDKIIGYALLNDINLLEAAILTSGRISSEMLLKTLKASIPMIISRSAPTDLAIKLAKEYDMTLVGFVRGKRMNIYHDKNRIF